MEELTIKLLNGSSDEIADVQKVLESASDYMIRTTGSPPRSGDAEQLLSDLPPGLTEDDKFDYGVYLEGEMIGVADVIRGYPDKDIAFLGLLLLAEKHQRMGWGHKAYGLLEDEIRQWEGIATIRIGVVRTNDEVLPFWKDVGFEDTGQKGPYRKGTIVSEFVYLDKKLS